MTTTTAPQVHIVRARDIYDTRRCASPKCRQAVKELDVVVIGDRTVTHFDCLSQRARDEIPASPDATRCWYGAATSQGCPFAIETHNLCTVHNAILYGAPVKKRAPKR